MESQAVIDPGTFTELKNLMGADFVGEVIDTYKLETEELIEGLRQAYADNDAPVFGRLAHSIKSSSASLGALGLAQQARELELLGKAHDLSAAGLKLEQLDAGFLEVKRCLEELRDEP